MFQAVRDEVRERAHRFSILRSRSLKMTENNVASVIFDEVCFAKNICRHIDTIDNVNFENNKEESLYAKVSQTNSTFY